MIINHMGKHGHSFWASNGATYLVLRNSFPAGVVPASLSTGPESRWQVMIRPWMLSMNFTKSGSTSAGWIHRNKLLSIIFKISSIMNRVLVVTPNRKTGTNIKVTHLIAHFLSFRGEARFIHQLHLLRLRQGLGNSFFLRRLEHTG